MSPGLVVVRGGQSRDPSAVLGKVIDNIADGVGPRLSVYCVERMGSTVAQDVLRACTEGDIPHGQVQVGTTQRLITAGFSIEHDPSDGQAACHYNVLFGNEPKITDAEAFIECFDEPIPNPRGPKERRRQP